jgi:hypothetical protein
MASSRCDQSFDTVSGFYFEKMSEKEPIASVDGRVPAEFFMCNSLEQPFSLSLFLLKKLPSS